MSDLGYRIAVLSCVPLRSEPNDRAEQVSQILAGEIVAVLSECDGNWMELCSQEDGYTGFADPRHFIKTTSSTDDARTVVNAPISRWVFEESKQALVLPAGSFLISDEQGFLLGGKRVTPKDEKPLGEELSSMNKAALQFLGAPYQWGGRTVLGIDCSGLVQTAARLVGTRLLRDASQQAEVGEIVEWEDRGVEDLAFFKNKDGKITHVGILTSRYQIVHASGEVRVDQLIEKGIIHSESGELTHTLSHIRRLVELRAGN